MSRDIFQFVGDRIYLWLFVSLDNKMFNHYFKHTPDFEPDASTRRIIEYVSLCF